MKPADRRARILKTLNEQEQAITGSELASMLDVSRQVIVQDIALLRAQGHRIVATPRGYLAPPETAGGTVRRTFASTHSGEDIAEELNLIVDNGGHVLDVTVEHPLYGELRGLLMIRSRYDVEEFVRKMNEQEARPLLALTGGPHLHTVEAASEASLNRIEALLGERGFLVREDNSQ
jgi:transcriptional regulator of NAD metabolism